MTPLPPAISAIAIAQLIISLCLLIATVCVGFLAVKHRRQVHLYWIIPFALSRALGLILTVSGYVRAFQGIGFGQPYSFMAYATVLTLMNAFAAAALAVVIWKSLGQPGPSGLGESKVPVAPQR